jgi:hypothetical protein
MSSGRGPLNYTTTIDPHKTAAECIALLARHGATRISMDLADGKPSALAFGIDTPNGMRFYVLPANPQGVYAALGKAYRERRIPQRYCDREQAERVAWRVLKDWLEAQLALIDAQVVAIDQVMLPYLIVDDSGLTLYQRYLEHGRKALESADEPGGTR